MDEKEGWEVNIVTVKSKYIFLIKFFMGTPNIYVPTIVRSTFIFNLIFKGQELFYFNALDGLARFSHGEGQR